MDIKNKNILIIGLSRSGYAAAKLSLRHKAKVWVTERAENDFVRKKAALLTKQGACVELGKHSKTFYEKADFIITSPGVKNDSLVIKWAKKKKVPVFSEIEFASWFCKTPIVAITGSNGKTTVTTLIGKILKKAGKKTLVCGNIGNPFSGEFENFKKADIVVLEASSFGLEYTHKFRPHISIILNITQNHFDHHKGMSDYTKAKAKIMVNQKKSDYAVFNFNDRRVRKLADKSKARTVFFSSLNRGKNNCFKKAHTAAWLEDNIIRLFSGHTSLFDFPVAKLKLKGVHNIENAMAAALAAKLLKVDDHSIKSVFRSFKGVEHRCELLSVKKGVVFVNDSKSTTVDATDKALSMFADKSVVLICGGRDKGSDFSVLLPNLKQKAVKVIAIGEAKSKLKSAYQGAVSVLTVQDLAQAADKAFKIAGPGQTVLLSPMCSSFDMFDNFEHRGKCFKKIVKGISK